MWALSPNLRRHVAPNRNHASYLSQSPSAWVTRQAKLMGFDFNLAAQVGAAVGGCSLSDLSAYAEDGPSTNSTNHQQPRLRTTQNTGICLKGSWHPNADSANCMRALVCIHQHQPCPQIELMPYVSRRICTFRTFCRPRPGDTVGGEPQYNLAHWTWVCPNLPVTGPVNNYHYF